MTPNFSATPTETLSLCPWARAGAALNLLYTLGSVLPIDLLPMTRFPFLIPSLCGALAGLTLLPLAAVANTPAPSLDDGIICVAKGKVDQGQRLYLYTSVIDEDSVKKKEPVTVTINQLMVTVEMDELVVLDPDNETLTVIDSVTGTPPAMQPSGLATTVYQGDNTFAGKTAAGTAVSFTLNKDYRTFQVKHAGHSLKGSCH